MVGSERLAKTEVDEERSKEAKFIKKSLSALGDVIASLGSKMPTSHIGNFFWTKERTSYIFVNLKQVPIFIAM